MMIDFKVSNDAKSGSSTKAAKSVLAAQLTQVSPVITADADGQQQQHKHEHDLERTTMGMAARPSAVMSPGQVMAAMQQMQLMQAGVNQAVQMGMGVGVEGTDSDPL